MLCPLDSASLGLAKYITTAGKGRAAGPAFRLHLLRARSARRGLHSALGTASGQCMGCLDVFRGSAGAVGQSKPRDNHLCIDVKADSEAERDCRGPAGQCLGGS